MNGTAVSVAEQRALGLVQVTWPSGYCSGALLTPNWALSAAHCLEAADGGGYSVILADGDGGTVSRSVDLAVLDPTWVEGSRTALADMLLLHLSGTPPVQWPTKVSMALDARALSVLPGTSVTCYGIGASTTSFTGGGVWGAGIFTISSITSDVFVFTQNGENQTNAPGDSGGPCFYVDSDGTIRHVGVLHGLTYYEAADGGGLLLDSDGGIVMSESIYTATTSNRAWIEETLASEVYASNYSSMYLRGTMSATTWDTSSPMTLVADHTWQVAVTLAAHQTYSYKYDSTGSWNSTSNWGVGGTSGTAAVNAGDISYTSGGAGVYTFTFNDSTLAYAVTAPAVSCTTVPVTFTIANADTVWGQDLYVVGNVAALGDWGPASSFALTIQGSGANAAWSGTVDLPPDTAIQYKYIKYDPTTQAVVWESAQSTSSGNRERTTPTCGDSGTFSDGDF